MAKILEGGHAPKMGTGDCELGQVGTCPSIIPMASGTLRDRRLKCKRNGSSGVTSLPVYSYPI
jgi:hypothetical protein